MPVLSIIIPAHNEASGIDACLSALLAQNVDAVGVGVEIVVVANGCTDDTVAVASRHGVAAEARGWSFTVMNLAEPGKTNALNTGDSAASGTLRLYLDADVTCGPGLLGQIAHALDRPDAAYASGRFLVSPASNWVTRHYNRLWTRLPFMTHGVPGGGLYAVNAAGRARWDSFPDIIADDSFVRLQFVPSERIGVQASYSTPMAEGWGALVRVRRRWDAGSRQLASRFPRLLANDDKPPLSRREHLGLMLRLPVSYLVYASIKIAIRFGRHSGWARAR